MAVSLDFLVRAAASAPTVRTVEAQAPCVGSALLVLKALPRRDLYLAITGIAEHLSCPLVSHSITVQIESLNGISRYSRPYAWYVLRCHTFFAR